MIDQTPVGHCKRDETDVYIGRGQDGRHLISSPMGDRGWLGNPYSESEYGRDECIRLFRADFEALIEADEDFREAVRDLHGHTLGCWCRSFDEDEPDCHGDVIAEWADRLAEGEEQEGSA